MLMGELALIGIFILLYKIFGNALVKIVDSFRNNKKRNAALNDPNNKNGTYFDVDMIERDIHTNKVRIHSFTASGDRTEVNERGKIVRNLDEEKREAFRKKQYSNPNVSVVCIDSDVFHPLHNMNVIGKPRGHVYQDKKTKEEYVIRMYGNCTFYMRISDNQLIRPTDKQIRYGKKEIEELYDIMNKYQDDFGREFYRNSVYFSYKEENMYEG